MLRSALPPAAMPDAETVPLEILHRTPGRIVLAEADGTLHLGRNQRVLASRDGGASWQEVAELPRSGLRRAAELSRLACRLLRHEVRALARLTSGHYVASNREGVFHGPGGRLAPSRVDVGALPLLPPMRLTRGPGDGVVFGEYGNPRAPRPIRLFASDDRGASFACVHTFAPGEVFHVHNLVRDPEGGHYWVLVGDFDDQPGIGILSGDFSRFEWFRKGKQEYRAVELFDLGDALLYATDTHLERNGLVTLDKRTGETRRHREFEGSCIYACRFGELFALTTTVETSPVNKETASSLWLSRDGFAWKRAHRAEKDGWSAKYFQFGSLVLPSGRWDRERIVFSGQAVRGLDGDTVVAELAPGASLQAGR